MTKFPLVGRALSTKNQSHEYNLDCSKIVNQSHEAFEHLKHLKYAFFHKQEACVLFGTVVLFSTEE